MILTLNDISTNKHGKKSPYNPRIKSDAPRQFFANFWLFSFSFIIYQINNLRAPLMRNVVNCPNAKPIVKYLLELLIV